MKSSKGKGNNKKRGTKKASVKSKKTTKPNSGGQSSTKENKYRSIQRLLSDYCKANGKNLGKKFNKYASEIAKGEKDVPLKYIEDNFDAIYVKYIESSDVKKEFPNNFPFYEFSDKLLSNPVYDGVMIGVRFDDGTEKFDFKGNAGEVLDYYRLMMHKYLRLNYNDSPYAEFHIADTDGKKFVDYEVRADGSPKPSAPTTPAAEKPTPQATPTQAGATQADVDLARAKADEEKAKAVKLALEMLKDGLITKEEFAEILKALK
jgi:hypothetical protein